MALRSRAMVPSTASRVLIRVDRYQHNCITGTMYNPYLDESVSFVDVMDFANRLDAMFDNLSFPQAAMEYRSFDKKGKKAKPAPAAGAPQQKGEQPVPKHQPLNERGDDVFVVHVQFRQNATWQGTVKWAGQNEEKHFRSTLELLKIMDSVLEKEGPNGSED